MKQLIQTNQRGIEALKNHQSYIFGVLQGTLTTNEAKKAFKDGLDGIVADMNEQIIEKHEYLCDRTEWDLDPMAEEREAINQREAFEQTVRDEEQKYLDSFGD